MPKTAFITGIAGQDGSYLANFLIHKGYRVIGISLEKSQEHTWRLDYFGIRNKVILYKGSLLNDTLIQRILVQYQPREIYNLASQSNGIKSWELPEETVEANYLAVVKLLMQIRNVSPKSRLFQASSVEIYGQTSGVITEKTDHFRPITPYGVAKLAAHQSVINYRERYGLFAVNGILFNHESPLRPPDFVTKIIAHGVADIDRKRSKILTLGSLTTQRDFGFAGDFVEGMWGLLQVKKPTDAVFCTGKTHSIEDFVQEAFRIIGIKKWQDYIAFDPNRVRKREIQTMQGSHRLLTKLTGWKPKVNFKQLVHMMMDFELQSNKKYGRDKK